MLPRMLYVDNFYTSPILFSHLVEVVITATGTFRTNRKNIPPEVLGIKSALERKSVCRGTGYYYQPRNSHCVYICWRDNRVVTVMSTTHPGHSEFNVSRKQVNKKAGTVTIIEIPRPVAVEQYN